MKAFIKSVKFIGASLVFLALAACGKSDNGTNVAAVQYAMQGNQCYDVTHNTPVAYNLCPGVGTTGQFQYVGNQCVAIANPSVPVDPTYCQQSLIGGQYGGQYGSQYPYGYGSGALPYGTGYSSYGTGYTSYGPGVYGGSATCIGMYYSYSSYNSYNPYSGGGQLIQCNGYNCSGQFLLNQQTRVRYLCL